jgi:hypothetical protein
VLVFVQPTRRRPGPRFLLEEGELVRLAGGLDVVQYREGWLEEGRHEALLVARRREHLRSAARLPIPST